VCRLVNSVHKLLNSGHGRAEKQGAKEGLGKEEPKWDCDGRLTCMTADWHDYEKGGRGAALMTGMQPTKLQLSNMPHAEREAQPGATMGGKPVCCQPHRKGNNACAPIRPNSATTLKYTMVRNTMTYPAMIK
jgi:hypothetical protein